uniref:Uncharacterized protein n=1 Tax=Bionectria ochroleuca TaxID=29856 RepID=A0A8H7NAW6_BIOOC
MKMHPASRATAEPHHASSDQVSLPTSRLRNAGLLSTQQLPLLNTRCRRSRHERRATRHRNGPGAPAPAETEPSRDNEATPTPAPAPAAADENVAPGPRATRLRALYGQALQHTLGKLAWENFAACYPTISSRSEGVLRQVQGQMVGKLGEKCQKEFDNIIVSRQVVPKLNELESLIADASKRRAESDDSVPDPTPPHLLPPTASSPRTSPPPSSPTSPSSTRASRPPSPRTPCCTRRSSGSRAR